MKKIIIAFSILVFTTACQSNRTNNQNDESNSNSTKHADLYLESTARIVSCLRNNQLDKVCDMADLDCYSKEIWSNVRNDIKKRCENARGLINTFGIAPQSKWKIASTRTQINPYDEDDTSTLLYEKILVPLNRQSAADSSILYFGFKFNCAKSSTKYIGFDILPKKLPLDDFDFDNPGITDYLPTRNICIARDFVRHLINNDKAGVLSLINDVDKDERVFADARQSYNSDYIETYRYVHNRKLKPTNTWKSYKVEVSSPSKDHSLFFDEVVIPFETESPNADDPVYLYVGFEKIFGLGIHEFGIITRKMSGADGDLLGFRHILSDKQYKMIHPDY